MGLSIKDVPLTKSKSMKYTLHDKMGGRVSQKGDLIETNTICRAKIKDKGAGVEKIGIRGDVLYG